MKVVHTGMATDKVLKLPTPPSFLPSSAKTYYKKWGKILIKAGVLKELHLTTLEMMATNYAQWIFAVKEINKKNRKKLGSGYIQVYASKATNISTELVLKRDAEKALRANIEAFGMDPQSEKKLKKAVDDGQGDLFEGFKKFAESKM